MPQSCVQRERAPPSLGLSRQSGLGTVPPHRSCALGNMMVEAFICDAVRTPIGRYNRSEEHTSELQSLMRISYAVFCLKQKKSKEQHHTYQYLTYKKIAVS